MATKKIKRFESGGVSDKDRGLEASKDDKVGFFERMRMGNIDEEGSEAYNRFGAGRGRASQIPVEDKKPTPVVRESAKPVTVTPLGPDSENNSVISSSREPIPVLTRPKARPGEAGSSVMIGGRPSIGSPAPANSPNVVTKKKEMTEAEAEKQLGLGGQPSAKDVAKAKAQLGIETSDRNENYGSEGRGSAKPSMRRGSVSDIPLDSPRTPVTGEKVDGTKLGRNLATTMAALGPVKGAGAVRAGVEFARANRVQDAFNKTATARRTAEMRAKGDATKFSSKPKATQKDSAKKTKKFDDEESNVEFKRGGMVSSASKRADGIATKGKTRCKMR